MKLCDGGNGGGGGGGWVSARQSVEEINMQEGEKGTKDDEGSREKKNNSDLQCNNYSKQNNF